MKAKTLALVLACSGLLLTGSIAVRADDAALLKSKGCINCHDAEKKKVGPAYKDLAKKGLKADAVVAKMKEGKGHPKVAGSDEDLKKATEAALATK